MDTLPKLFEVVQASGDESPKPLRKVKFSDLNIYRILSFRDAIDDFIKHSKEVDINSDGVWLLITQILSAQRSGEVWWALSGDKVICYFILTGAAELNGNASLMINHGWSDRCISPKISHHYLEQMCQDAFKRGACRVWFMTRREPKSYQRWLGKQWTHPVVLFERR